MLTGSGRRIRIHGTASPDSLCCACSKVFSVDSRKNCKYILSVSRSEYPGRIHQLRGHGFNTVECRITHEGGKHVIREDALLAE